MKINKKYKSRANVSLLEILSLVNCVSPRNSPFAVSIYTIDSKINLTVKTDNNSVNHFYNFLNILLSKVIKIIIRFVSKVLKRKKKQIEISIVCTDWIAKSGIYSKFYKGSYKIGFTQNLMY